MIRFAWPRPSLRAALALVLLLPLAALAARAESTLERVQRTGTIKVGFANEAPYGYLTDDGRLTGEAPEVARAVLKRMGVTKLEGVLTEFGALIPGLKAGRFDIIAAGMYVIPKRCRQVAFSEPSYSIGEAFAVPEGNPKGLHGYMDVKRKEDVRLGVMAGAVEGGYARALGVPRDRIVYFPDNPTGIAAVRSGRVDAFAGTSLTIQVAVGKVDGVERAQPFEELVIDGKSVRGYGAFAFRKSDPALLEAFNAKLLEFRGSPEHLALVKPFGFTASEMPDKTTAELCKG